MRRYVEANGIIVAADDIVVHADDRIITNNIITWLDSADPASYDSFTWYDLTLNHNDATLDGVGFDGADAGGVMVFDGAFSNASLNMLAATNWTISIWIKETGAQSGMYGRVISTAGFYWELALNGINSNIEIYNASGWTSYPGITLTTNRWCNLVFTYNHIGTELKIYKNSVLVDTSANARNFDTTLVEMIGARATPAEFGKFNLGHYLVYDAPLNQTEINYNFDLLRSRFGA